MQECDLIICGRFLLTMNSEMEVIEEGAIAVKGGLIADIGPASEIKADYSCAEKLETGNSIVLPGLVNTHTHAAMSYFRGMADDLPLDIWLTGHIWPAEKNQVNAGFVREGSRLAMLEMAKAGVTCFNDMYFFEDETARLAKQAGMRAVVGIGLLKFPTPDSANSQEALAKTDSLLSIYRSDPLIKLALCPHSIYAAEREIIVQAAEMSRRHNLLLHMHVAETKKEVDECRLENGLTPAGYLDKLGVLTGSFLAAHCVWMDADDLEIFKKRGVKVSHNPVSNMKLASGTAPVALMQKMGITVGLGTDGAASNNTLDLFSEMRTASILHKAMNNDPSLLPAAAVVKMATIDGARALGLDGTIGSLEAGKSADIITLSLDKPHLSPLYDPYAHLVYSAGPADVDNTIIAGRIIMHGRKMLTMDEGEIIAEAQMACRKKQ